MKKILLINWRDIRNPEAGGAEIYYHEIFKRICRKGYSVTLISHRFPGSSDYENIEGINIIRKGSKFLFNFQIIPFLLHKAADYDLIIEDLNKIPFFTPLFIKQPRLHLVMHFFGSEIFREAVFPAALYVFFMEKLIPFVYRKEKFVAISGSTASEIEAIGVPRGNIGIVEPGIDTSFYRPVCSKADPPIIVYIGRLMKYKNIQFVISALPLLKKEVPGLSFEIGGEGDYLNNLRKCADKYGVSDSIRFLGKISEDEKIFLLSRASLFVNPSAKEGWGINNIEANLCGTVSLSGNVAGLRDSVLDGLTGILYKPDDIEDFCKKALLLLTDNVRRREMEQAALERARTLDWDTAAEKMMKFL